MPTMQSRTAQASPNPFAIFAAGRNPGLATQGLPQEKNIYQANFPGQSFQGGAGNDALYAYLHGQQLTDTAAGGYANLSNSGQALLNLAGPQIGNLLKAYESEVGLPQGGGQGGVTAASSAIDPYSLTGPEQVQLNAQLDAVNNHFQALQQNVASSLAARGIDPNSEAGLAATAYLGSQQTSAAAQVQAGFMENIRQTKIQQTADAIGMALQTYGAGAQVAGAGAGGTAGLAAQEAGVTGTLGGVAMQDAGSNIGSSIINDVGSLLGAWAGGAFKGTPTFGTGTGNAYNDPYIMSQLDNALNPVANQDQSPSDYYDLSQFFTPSSTSGYTPLASQGGDPFSSLFQ